MTEQIQAELTPGERRYLDTEGNLRDVLRTARRAA